MTVNRRRTMDPVESGLLIAAITLSVTMVLAGLAILAPYVVLVAALSSWGSNK